MLKYYQFIRYLLFGRGKGSNLLCFDKVDGRIGRKKMNENQALLSEQDGTGLRGWRQQAHQKENDLTLPRLSFLINK